MRSANEEAEHGAKFAEVFGEGKVCDAFLA